MSMIAGSFSVNLGTDAFWFAVILSKNYPLFAGLSVFDCRSLQIRESFLAKEEYKSNKILWVVGANHLAGLLVNFEKLGANIASVSFESVQNSVSG